MHVRLHTTDSAVLEARVTMADDAVGVVVIAGATAVPQVAYARFAAFLASRGLTVLTFDYRGIGESRAGSLRGERATMQDWGRRDLEAALQWALTRPEGLPVLLVGHSFGGQALGLAPSGDQLSGVLTVGAQLGWYGHWPTRPARLRLLATWAVAVPVLTALYGYLPGWAGTVEDLPAGVAREWARWCRSPGYLIDLVTDAEARFASVQAPATVLAILDDDYAPTPAVHAFAALLPRATVRQVGPADAGTDHIGHFGFFRPRCRVLWADAADQLLAWAATPTVGGLEQLRLAVGSS